MVKIKLDISRHCIETEIKRMYEKKLGEYFRKKYSPHILEEEIEALSYVLQNIDFPSLRTHLSSIEKSRGIKEIFFIVSSPHPPHLLILPLRGGSPITIFLNSFLLHG